MMNRTDFIKLYERERPMYKAWANFVLTEIDAAILERASSKRVYSEWVKIEPSSRVKDIDSLITKAFIRKRDKYQDPYNEITDKAGIRFVVLLTSQLEFLCEIVERTNKWIFSKDREFDEWKNKDPRIFDYESSHYIVRATADIEYEGSKIKEGTPCEVQLRTLLQHAYAELAHDTIYKGDVTASPKVQRNFAKSMALMETTDDLLCNAKATLDAATSDLDKWKESINREATKRLGGIKLIDDNKSFDYLLSNLKKLLEKTSIENFVDFLDNSNYSYISNRIKEKQNDEIEFRHPFVLLIYFLAKRFSGQLYKNWPLDVSPLEKIYSDLGITPSWVTT